MGPSLPTIKPGSDENKKQSNSAQRFRCPEDGCNKSYTRSNKLKCHISCAHRREKPFRCIRIDCSMWFSNKADCQRHEKTHRLGISPPSRVPCEKCGKTFTRRDYLLDHQRKRCAALKSKVRESSPAADASVHELGAPTVEEVRIHAIGNSLSNPPRAATYEVLPSSQVSILSRE
jgi:hypothetical protein